MGKYPDVKQFLINCFLDIFDRLEVSKIVKFQSVVVL